MQSKYQTKLNNFLLCFANKIKYHGFFFTDRYYPSYAEQVFTFLLQDFY